MQLIYGGQPFIFEKTLKLSTGEEKRYWRCNQWWNQKCRSRVFTINDIVCPLNRFHTHEEIVRRKKRVRRVPPTAEATAATNVNVNANTNANAKIYATASIRQDQLVQPQQVHQQQQQQQHHHQQQQQQQLASDAMLTTTLTDESTATIDVNELGMHLKYEEIVADVTGIVGATHSHSHSHASRVLGRKK
ncbi:mediator of RNA polymerase II transcription subunit 23 [Drosophila albomicans]|uniref:Mediator of RNA polymerase II transcription subunit 23 n=1 Tax=Drosophila albomicans TaxID=7291 RepID=A0A6P8XH38_DROAB|nr:mediator of RNA polymerase II transcription subunit 23 [Drosophila albomicans]